MHFMLEEIGLQDAKRPHGGDLYWAALKSIFSAFISGLAVVWRLSINTSLMNTVSFVSQNI